VTHFASVVLDVDSTISTLEGIDWLASLRAPDVARAVEQLTNDAMESRVPLDAVYAQRLSIIRPTRAELTRLSAAYIETAVPGVKDAISRWQRAGVRVILVSGGLRDAILPMAEWLGIEAADVHAVNVTYDVAEIVSGVAGNDPLAQRGGKPRVVNALALPRPSLAVGDGATDAELVTAVDRFIAFVGVVRRESVVARASSSVESFAALTTVIMGPNAV
jgi:phosphoserine phosphatase